MLSGRAHVVGVKVIGATPRQSAGSVQIWCHHSSIGSPTSRRTAGGCSPM
jgi:hypothetical protein